MEGWRKSREPSQSVVERRRSEAIVGSHLPTLAALQSRVARLTAQVQHGLRVGEPADRQLREAEETLDSIRQASDALSLEGRPADGRVTDVAKSLASLYDRAEKVRATIVQRQRKDPG